MSDDLIDAIDASTRSLEEFKREQRTRIDELEREIQRKDAKLYGRIKNGTLSNGGESGAGRTIAGMDDPEYKAMAVYLRTGDARQLKALDVTNSAEGGYAVPKQINALIEKLLLPRSPIRQFATVQPTSSGDFHQLVSLGGFAAAWAAEMDARAPSTAGQFADVIPPSGDLWANPQISQWLADDAFFDVVQYVSEMLADAFADAESTAFISGDGSTKPKGILSYTAVATGDATRAFGQIEYVPTGAAGAFATVSATVSPFDVLATTISKWKVGYRDEAQWYMAPSTLAVLTTVKDAAGRPVLITPLTAGMPPMLCGYPVCECEHWPAIASNAYAIGFGNLRRTYIVTDRIGTRILVDPYSQKPMIGVYSTRRTGGAVKNSQSFKLIKFSTT